MSLPAACWTPQGDSTCCEAGPGAHDEEEVQAGEGEVAGLASAGVFAEIARVLLIGGSRVAGCVGWSGGGESDHQGCCGQCRLETAAMRGG
jgi:hypothetical protein